MWHSKSNTKLVGTAIEINPWIPINYSRLLSDTQIKTKSVLIIGANSGYEASLFLRDGAKKVVGVDIFTPEFQFRHRRYNFVESAAECLPFPDNYFDIVYSQAVLEHVRDVSLTWEESLRVTKSGGIVAHIASPLWYSRDGHHRQDLFGNHPWCHVGRTLVEWKTWAKSIKEFEFNLSEIHHAMDYCMNELNINQEAPSIFSNSLKSLSNIEVIRDAFDLDSTIDSVPSEVISRISLELSEIDLRKVTHCGIVKKL